MCGIIAYTGERPAGPILLEGLRRLEYRGYDSAGIAIAQGGEIALRRAVGKLGALEEMIKDERFPGRVGIGHTRWATHGRPSVENAHPHLVGRVVIVHNGIIENYAAIREALEASGREVETETDTELIAHLVDAELADGADLLLAVQRVSAALEGSYAIAALSRDEPERLVAAKNGGSPIVIGVGEDEAFVASDIPAMLPYTRQILFLEDGDFASIDADGVRVEDAAGAALERLTKTIAWDPVSAEKGGYDRFMQKEIFEQPRAITDTVGTRVGADGSIKLDDIEIDEAWARQLSRVHIVACGTAYYAGMVGKYMIERLAGVPVEADLASEYRYRDPLVHEDTLIIPVSQSGETADTLAALREGRDKGGRVLAICNVRDATIARESHDVLYTHAGPEIGVASTKAFTTQIVALYLLALRLGIARGRLAGTELAARIAELHRLRRVVEAALRLDDQIREIAHHYKDAKSFLYLGRGVMHPIALEGALKLKEISYIHAEGYAAGEMKHGPIALIDEEMPVVVIATQSPVYDKVVSNMEVVRARDGQVIAIASEGDEAIGAAADHVIRIPDAGEFLSAVVAVVPLQLLAYHVAVLKGTDIDQPRNLAKSVTVE